MGRIRGQIQGHRIRDICGFRRRTGAFGERFGFMDGIMDGVKDTILLVEDDADILEVIDILLSREGFHVLKAENGGEAMEQMKQDPRLVILDIMLPDISGIDLCKTIRRDSTVPILFLTAKGSLHDKTEGFNAGADDYLVKPFFQEELLARVTALLRRYELYKGIGDSSEKEKTLKVGVFEVNKEFNEVYKDGRPIEMTDIEYRILKLLMQYHNKIFSIRNIYESVWEKPYFYDSNNTVMVHIRRLRMAIEDDPQHPVYIRTEWGRGYRFVCN